MLTSSDPVYRSDVVGLLATAAFAAVLLAPLRHYTGSLKKLNRAKLEADSFPISTYPMFSADRGGQIVIPYVLGQTVDGERVNLHYRWFGTGGSNQVRKQVARAVREGRAAEVAQQYADALAARPTKHQIVEVLVARSRFIFAEYFSGNTTAFAENIHARCAPGSTAQELFPGKLAKPTASMESR